MSRRCAVSQQAISNPHGICETLLPERHKPLRPTTPSLRWPGAKRSVLSSGRAGDRCRPRGCRCDACVRSAIVPVPLCRGGELSWPLPATLTEQGLEPLLFAPLGGCKPGLRRKAEPDWAAVHRELRRPGVTLLLPQISNTYREPAGGNWTFSRANPRRRASRAAMRVNSVLPPLERPNSPA
jgi:hypothetical protein